MRAREVLIAALPLIAATTTFAQDAPVSDQTAPAPPAADTDEETTAPVVPAPTGEETAEPVAPASIPVVELGETPERAKQILDFADHLFSDGDWYRAITEYRRFLFEVKGRDREAPRAAIAIGEALLRGEQYDAAGRQLDGVAQRTTSAEQRLTALFGAGRAYLLDNRPELAKPRLRVVADDSEAPARLREEARWLLAWGHFDANEFEQATKLFTEIADQKGAHAESASGVVQSLGEQDQLDRKDPLIAGALSLIPGVGHFYLGRWGVGLTSLAWNGLFLFATVSAWLTGNWGIALVLTLFEIGWYAGGVFGAVSGAMRHNRDAVKNWRDEVLVRFGQGREMPAMHEFDHRTDALPGRLVRFGVPVTATPQ